MVQNPPPGVQRLVPYLAYDDAPAAIDFLCRAFGFEERMRLPMESGRIGHAELALPDAVLYLASSYPEMALVSPRGLPAVACQLTCYVDDVDAHYARAREAGAIVDAGPEDQFYGERRYRAQDPEGHHWTFTQRVRDVPPEEWEVPD